MSGALFDAALRVAAADAGTPVARLLHVPVLVRPCAVAVTARRAGKGVRVQAIGADGAVHEGVGAAGLAAIATAAGGPVDALAVGPTGVLSDAVTLPLLARLAGQHTDPARESAAVVAGSAVAGWWCERADHPGSGAVCELLPTTRQRWVLGVVPGQDTAVLWRRALRIGGGTRAALRWHRAVTAGTGLPGLGVIAADDDWLLERYRDSVGAGRSWQVPESLGLAAQRLRSRCDAADVYSAALLDDPIWRARGVHTGHVLAGTVAVGAASGQGRVQVAAQRLDTRLRVGSEVVGWAGAPLDPMPGPGDRFTGAVTATAVEHGTLVVTVGGLGRSGYRPTASEPVTVIGAPPSPSTIRSARMMLARLYKRRFSWLSQGATPEPVRRDVPLDVLIAAAEDDDEPAPPRPTMREGT